MELERKFRVIADIIQEVSSGTKAIDDVKKALSRNGMLRATEVESLTMLAMKLGFIEGSDDNLSTTKSGIAFEQYMTSLDEQEMAFEEGAPNKTPTIDKGTEFKLCVTVPPKMMSGVKLKFGDSLVDTLTGQKMVTDDCNGQLIIVSPYLDPAVLQLGLSSIYSKETELIVITSEKDFMKYKDNNYWLINLKKFINNRFAHGKIFYLEELSSIAHAKVWCCQKSALITSANVQSNSSTENLEIGIYTDDPIVVGTLWSFLNFILSEGGLKCILDTRH
jgi:hypothetical protein